MDHVLQEEQISYSAVKTMLFSNLLNAIAKRRVMRASSLQYLGQPGISEACVQAVHRMLQYNDRIESAKLLTCDGRHGLLLFTNCSHDLVAIKCGFASGYNGEGPKALGRVLKLLEDFNVDIDEILVDQRLLDRLDSARLFAKDLWAIESKDPVRPCRVHDYIFESGLCDGSLRHCWDGFRPVLPYSLIDRRVRDLALRFWTDPCEALLAGYRRLEDVVRARAGLHEHGSKLFALAFQRDDAPLTWRDLPTGEIAARVSLFIGAYGAHRNPRAHKETHSNELQLLSEFLLLNHLFRLEAEAIEAPESRKS